MDDKEGVIIAKITKVNSEEQMVEVVYDDDNSTAEVVPYTELEYCAPLAARRDTTTTGSTGLKGFIRPTGRPTGPTSFTEPAIQHHEAAKLLMGLPRVFTAGESNSTMSAHSADLSVARETVYRLNQQVNKLTETNRQLTETNQHLNRLLLAKDALINCQRQLIGAISGQQQHAPPLVPSATSAIPFV